MTSVIKLRSCFVVEIIHQIIIYYTFFFVLRIVLCELLKPCFMLTILALIYIEQLFQKFSLIQEPCDHNEVHCIFRHLETPCLKFKENILVMILALLLYIRIR